MSTASMCALWNPALRSRSCGVPHSRCARPSNASDQMRGHCLPTIPPLRCACAAVCSGALMHPRRVQGDIKKLQVATASGAKVWESCSAFRTESEAVMHEANARAAAAGAAAPPAELQDSASAATADAPLTVLHVACSKGCPAVVEFLWQVCTLYEPLQPFAPASEARPLAACAYWIHAWRMHAGLLLIARERSAPTGAGLVRPHAAALLPAVRGPLHSAHAPAAGSG
jgi:hypothetical protein